MITVKEKEGLNQLNEQSEERQKKNRRESLLKMNSTLTEMICNDDPRLDGATAIIYEVESGKTRIVYDY